MRHLDDGKRTIYELQHRKWRNIYLSPISEKKKRKLSFELEKRKTKNLSKITTVNEQESSVQSAGGARAVQV